MNSADIVLRNGRVFSSGEVFHGGLAITDGKIVSLGANPFLPVGRRELDLQGALLLPGGVDTHVHVRDPGRRERGDFATETVAAAAGGITTILEMPISDPPQYSPEILRDRMRCAAERSSVDFAFYGAAGNRAEFIPALAKAGVIAFKTFLFAPSAGREGEFQGTCAEDDGALLQILETVAGTGKICAVHAENDSIVQRCTAALKRRGEKDFLAHGKARPPIAEVSAVGKVLCYAQSTGARVSICHVSTPEAMELIRRAKRQGVQVYAETCPQFLFCDEESVAHLGPFAKFNPPIRPQKSSDKLWQYVLDGTVDYVGSDHGPFLPSEKEPGLEDIFACPSGSTGFEERLPLFITAVREKRITLQRTVDLLSTNAAKVFDLFPRKGALAVGADGDVVAVDTERDFIIRASCMKTAGRGIAKLYEGRRVFGQVMTCLVRGRIVYSASEEVPSASGWGRCVLP
ncbi:MAG: amidohydrolase family protein [Fretibacterium sp.]|nr:amidohydrolase family protein [Fretibacterium sp.]